MIFQKIIIWRVDNTMFWEIHFDGLMQDCSYSIANALELLQSCTKPSISGWQYDYFLMLDVQWPMITRTQRCPLCLDIHPWNGHGFHLNRIQNVYMKLRTGEWQILFRFNVVLENCLINLFWTTAINAACNGLAQRGWRSVFCTSAGMVFFNILIF